MYEKPALVVLLLIATGYITLGCDFELAQSVDGDISRVQAGSLVAVLQLKQHNGNWTGYAKRGDYLTISDQSGFSKTSNFSQLPAKQQGEINNLFRMPLDGTAMVGSIGKFFLDDEFGQIQNVSMNEKKSISFHGDHLDSFLYADRSGFHYNHIFVLLKSKRLGAIEVDKNCHMRVYPMVK